MTVIRWLEPSACDPPHQVTHREKFEALLAQFAQEGWGWQYPALVGYETAGRVQLLSGSHRWAAADAAGIRVPVRVRSRAVVQRAWGDLSAWTRMMQADA